MIYHIFELQHRPASAGATTQWNSLMGMPQGFSRASSLIAPHVCLCTHTIISFIHDSWEWTHMRLMRTVYQIWKEGYLGISYGEWKYEHIVITSTKHCYHTDVALYHTLLWGVYKQVSYLRHDPFFRELRLPALYYTEPHFTCTTYTLEWAEMFAARGLVLGKRAWINLCTQHTPQLRFLRVYFYTKTSNI